MKIGNNFDGRIKSKNLCSRGQFFFLNAGSAGEEGLTRVGIEDKHGIGGLV